jgi:hypothetical protein
LEVFEDCRRPLEQHVHIRLLKVLEDKLLCIVVDLVDGVNDGFHAVNRYLFELLELRLKLLSLLQGNFVLPVLDYLPVESKRDFILIEVFDQGKVFVADLVFDEPSLLILQQVLSYGLL